MPRGINQSAVMGQPVMSFAIYHAQEAMFAAELQRIHDLAEMRMQKDPGKPNGTNVHATYPLYSIAASRVSGEPTVQASVVVGERQTAERP